MTLFTSLLALLCYLLYTTHHNHPTQNKIQYFQTIAFADTGDILTINEIQATALEGYNEYVKAVAHGKNTIIFNQYKNKSPIAFFSKQTYPNGRILKLVCYYFNHQVVVIHYDPQGVQQKEKFTQKDFYVR